MIFLGDCLSVLRSLPDCSVDAVVTDPPYGLSFMGKKWDYDVPSEEVWRECLRVLKPGGHLLAFAGTRTQHRMAVRIEDAGFEIRDMIAWVYGSGFPKSLDVSKAITNRADPVKVREIKIWLAEQIKRSGKTKAEINRECNFTASDYLKTEPGNDAGGRATWHTLLPYGDKWARLKAVVGFGNEYDAEIQQYGIISEQRHRPKENQEIYGKYSGTITDYELTAPARQWQGWGTALKPALEPITVARKPLIGTVAENVLAHGTGALNIDGCRIEGAPPSVPQPSFNSPTGRTYGMKTGEGRNGKMSQAAGRWPANLIHDGSEEVMGLLADAARFFYAPKASKRDRDEGMQIDAVANRQGNRPGSPDETGKFPDHDHRERTGNFHPTVKPTDLMRYLCRLVTPPGGTVLDPFMGSGSTGKAAILEGFNFIGIEREADYVEIAKARIASAQAQPKQESLF